MHICSEKISTTQSASSGERVEQDVTMFMVLQVGLIAARRTGRLRGTREVIQKGDKE